MQKLIHTFILASLSLPLMAETLTPQEALSRALSSPVARVAAAGGSRVTAYDYAGRIGRLYAFDRKDGRGAIITTDDSSLRPVVAVLDQGTSSQLNPAAEALLDEINAQIAAAKGVTQTPVDQYMEWTPVEPITTTRWDQAAPYFDHCPKINGTNCATGCVATAMAQIVAANGYAETKGTVSYNFYYQGQPVSHSFDFGANPIDFDNLKDTYSKADSGTKAGEAVANLMAACGASVRMSYGIGSSGASVNDVATALVTYFGYPKNNVAYIPRLYITTARWEGIIYGELSQGRPVYYGGYTPSGGGHSFVCDGYASDGLFHFNFGWSGFGNGYYVISAINPDQQGIGSSNGGYNMNQEIIVACPPGQTMQDLTIDYSEVTKYNCVIRDLALSGTESGSKQVNADFVIVNTGNVDLNFQPYATLEGSKAGWKSQEHVICPPGCSMKYRVEVPLVDDKTGATTPDGDYVLVIADDAYQPLSQNAKVPFTLGTKPMNIDFKHDEKAEFAIPNLDSFPGVVKSGQTVSITAMCTTDDPVALSLAFYAPGTNQLVYSTESTKCVMENTNGEYKSGQSYKVPTLNIAMGMYDMEFKLYDSPCSPRKTVSVQGKDNGLTYTPLDEKGSVELTSGSLNKASVEIPQSVKVGDSQFDVTSLGASLLEGNSKIKELTIPSTVTSMGHHSLYGLSSLQKLIMHSPVVPFEHIGYPASYLPASTIVYCPDGSIADYTKAFAPRRVMPLSEAVNPWISLPQLETAIDEVEDVVTGPCYDLQGRRIGNPIPGRLYITGGRKAIR